MNGQLVLFGLSWVEGVQDVLALWIIVGLLGLIVLGMFLQNLVVDKKGAWVLIALVLIVATMVLVYA